MMRRVNPTYRRFAAAKQGVAAVEFALVLPILVVMLLATFDGGRAIAAYMKMRAATYALASITNQYATIQSVDMTSILGATSVVMAPYSSGTPAVKISQVTINKSGVATIEWSAAQGTTADHWIAHMRRRAEEAWHLRRAIGEEPPPLSVPARRARNSTNGGT